MNRSRLLRYCTVGVAATALHYAVLVAAVELAGFAAALASALGSVGGAAFSYACNRRFTFESSARHRQALPRFVAVAVLGAGVNAVVVALGTLVLGWHYLIAQVLATLLVLLGGFTLNRFWTFA
ncbi:MAG: GtrA family protein [Burkholderiaceae bacterium]